MIEITPNNFIDYLRNPGKISECFSVFHNYSILNQWLAMGQAKPIGPLNTFKGWEKLGRHVKKGERAIELLMPIVKTEEDEYGKKKIVKQFFIPRKLWFTVHQTEGDEFTPVAPGFDFTDIDNKLSVTKIPFAYPDGNTQGYATKRNYAINPVAEDPLMTMFHELAHILLGHTDKDDMVDMATLAPNIKEFQAESVALICGAVVGQSQTQLDHALGYINNWGVPKELDKKMIEKLFSTANKIISACKV